MAIMATEKLPYDAKHVVYRDEGTMVHAFWAADADVARQLADPNTPNEVIRRLWFRSDVEIVADATRFYKNEGATFSGWIIASGGYHSDQISNKREAMKSLKAIVADYFAR